MVCRLIHKKTIMNIIRIRIGQWNISKGLFMSENESNQESNHGKNGGLSLPFLKNKGRFANLSPEERSSIARKGGLTMSSRKRLSSQLNAIKTGQSTKVIQISKCNGCPLKNSCHLYKPNAACRIELNLRRNLILRLNAVTGNNPEDLLQEILRVYQRIEDEVSENPSFNHLLIQIKLLVELYKLKYGDYPALPRQDAITSNWVKQAMTDLRNVRGDVSKKEPSLVK